MCQQASVCTPRYSNPPKSRRRCAEVTLFSELTGLGGFNEATFHVLVAGNALFLFVVVATLVAALSDGSSQAANASRRLARSAEFSGVADAPDFSKMRIKELRKILDDRGVECHGCSEKGHLVEKVPSIWNIGSGMLCPVPSWTRHR